MIRSAFCLLVGVALFCLAGSSAFGDKSPAERETRGALDGAWRLVASRSGDTGELVKAPKDCEHMKFIAGRRFLWTNVKDGKISSAAGGKCRLRNGRYTERVQHVLLESDKWLVGGRYSFECTLEGDTWYHKGVMQRGTEVDTIYQVWKRVK